MFVCFLQDWITADTCDLDPVEWGWRLSHNAANEKFHPVFTDKDIAPEHLLRHIRCKCNKGCKPSKCLCLLHGKKCTLACRPCRGFECSNSSEVVGTLNIDESLADFIHAL